jgi:hypothetical protein
MAISARKTTIRSGLFSSKGVEASTLRRRKYALIRRFGIPENALGGSLNRVERKCGKPTCRCASGDGHPMWTLTYSVDGQRHVEFIPEALVPLLKPFAQEGRAYREAVAQVLTINAQLVSLWRQQQRDRESKTKKARRAKKTAPLRRRKK